MRFPNLDPLDDARPPGARDPSEESTIVDMGDWSVDRNPLDAFAPEPVSRPQPSAPPKRFELSPAEVERPARLHLERPERLERSERSARFAIALAIAAVVAIAVATLNQARGFIARQPEAPAFTQVEHQDPSAGQRPEPATSATGITGNAAVPRTTDDPVLESLPVIAQKQRARVADARPARPEPRSQIVREPPRSAALQVVGRTAQRPEQQSVPTTGIARATETEADDRPSPPLAPVGSALGSTVPAAAPAAPVPAPEPVPAPPSTAVAVARVIAPRAAVESVLSRYAVAFSSLDAQGAKAVWPSVNERNLQRAFENLEEQAFDLGSCDIMVLPPRALAQCSGTARYKPKAGNRRERTEARRWTFRLGQNGLDWSIENVESR